jgi:hypothetical protein
VIQKPGESAKLAELIDQVDLSKLFEKFLLPRLYTIIERHKLILNHQFGFQRSQSQNRYTEKNNDLEIDRYYMAVFLNAQAFNNLVRCDGVLQKIIRLIRCLRHYKILFITNFIVKYREWLSEY